MGLERLGSKNNFGQITTVPPGGKIRGILSVERRDQAVPLFRSRTMRPVHPVVLHPRLLCPRNRWKGRSFMSRRLPREVAHSVQLDRRER